MPFNFDQLLIEGQNAGDQVIKNNTEIAEVLQLLQTSISNYLGVDVDLCQDLEYEVIDRNDRIAQAFGTLLINKKTETGNTIVSIRHKETTIKREIFLLKKTSHGYPITVIFGKTNYVNETQEEFGNAIGLVVSNPQTNLMLRSFKGQVEAEMKKIDGYHTE